MENEKKFIDGLWVDAPREGAPEFVKGRISINAKFIDWYNANKNDKGYVNIDVLESQEGKWYAKHNEWKATTEGVTTGGVDDDIPF